MISKADSDLVRRQNRHLVLEALRFAGHASRTELGRRTGLSLATITSITTNLLGEGLLLEEADQSHDAGRRGRPSVDLRLNPASGLVLALKLSIDTFELIVSDYAGVRIAHERKSIATYNMPADQVALRIADFLNEILQRHKIKPKAIRSAAIAVQGVAEIGLGQLMWSPAFRAEDIPLREPLQRLTGVSFQLANDANMIAEGLMAREHYEYTGTAAVMFMGYGVGMGLVIDGKAYHGATGAAAEFGHMNHIPHGALCRCGRAGCLEAYASDYGILRHAEGLPDSVPPPSSAINPDVMLKLEQAARQGEPHALAAYRKAGEAAGFGLARMIALLNPDRIVISGPGLRAFDLIEPALKTAIAEGVVPALRKNLKIEILPMNHDMIITGTLEKLLHDLDREVSSGLPPQPTS
jgi:predicted NBD/HSP70 family sugar kinase